MLKKILLISALLGFSSLSYCEELKLCDIIEENHQAYSIDRNKSVNLTAGLFQGHFDEGKLAISYDIAAHMLYLSTIVSNKSGDFEFGCDEVTVTINDDTRMITFSFNLDSIPETLEDKNFGLYIWEMDASDYGFSEGDRIFITDSDPGSVIDLFEKLR